MKEAIFNIIDTLKEDLVEDICKLVRIESIKEDDEYPYGKKINDALNEAIKICEREGLRVRNIDGQMAYGAYGESEEYIGIFGHLDVVDTLDGWKVPPFSATVSDNKIWGRGALDNKGPIMAALYAVLALKKLKIEPKREIRIIFGTNEESGMNDIKYYLQKEKAPLIGFTPDNKFPAIYGERGRAVIEISDDIKKITNFINEYFMNAKDNGDRLGINISDSDFGEMFIRNKILNYENNQLSIKFSLSTPRCDINAVINQIQSKAKGAKVRLLTYTPCILHNKDATLIKILNDSYNEIMNTNLTPTTTTGGTYAHICKTIIPFGPSFPGQKGIAHQPNEYVDIDDLIKWTKIYAYAIYKLAMLDEIEEELITIT